VTDAFLDSWARHPVKSRASDPWAFGFADLAF
jgi:hypothetical protein